MTTSLTISASQPAARPVPAGNTSDQNYLWFLERVRARFLKNATGPLFTTDADLWDAYLSGFPEDTRQFYNCHACRHFLQRYGGLATIDENGTVQSALWNAIDADDEHETSLTKMQHLVRRATITGVFLSSDKVWGTPVTKQWIHLAVRPPPALLFNKVLLNASQAMAEKREDHKNVMRALVEFPAPLVDQALTLLKSEALYRNEKVIGPAQFLADLHATKGNRTNQVWRAIASAPAGFCHPRSSMVGTLLEDLASGAPFESVAQRFAAKMSPIAYQRPQAAPSTGAIAAAEKVIEQLGAAGSLARRFARLDECVAIWRPRPPQPGRYSRVFGHLVPKDAAAFKTLKVPTQTMTWIKFVERILPGARAIDHQVRYRDAFCALVTAENPDAPPILQWDLVNQRNPVSWYLYQSGSLASQWNLKVDASWTKVTAVVEKPTKWYDGNYPHQGAGTLLILEGARDTGYAKAGVGLFPEILKSEFHGIRSTIEAYSRSATLGGYEEASACGVMMGVGSIGITVRVTDQSGNQFEYLIDRLD